MKIVARLELTQNELEYLDEFAMGLIKQWVDIDIKLKEVDEKLKYYDHPAYTLTRNALLEDKETILSLISKIKGMA